MTHII